MPAVCSHAAAVIALFEGWHEVTELDVERDLVRRLPDQDDGGPALEDADEEERVPLRVKRWQRWVAS